MNEQIRLTKIGEKYSMFHKDLKINMFRARTILSHTRGQKVLELGCGDGLVTSMLIRKFKNVHAVDASRELLEKAKKRAPGARFYFSLFEKFDTQIRFDTIILGHVLEHVSNPLIILRLAQRWLKPSGRMIITVPNGNSFHRLLGAEMGMLKYPAQVNKNDLREGHRRVFTLDTLRDIVLKAKLHILHEEGIFFKPLTNKQTYHWPKRLLEACYQLGKKLPPQYGGELFIMCRLRKRFVNKKSELLLPLLEDVPWDRKFWIVFSCTETSISRLPQT